MTGRCKNITIEDRHYADQLWQRRAALGLPLRAVHKATGISLNMLWRYENACNRCSAIKREMLDMYYSGIEAERGVAAGSSTAEHSKLNQQARKIIGSIIDQLTALLIEANDVYSDPAAAEINGKDGLERRQI